MGLAVINRKWKAYCRIGALLPFFSESALGRWNHQEADALNRVTGLGTEYYNDILSYREPLTWNRSLGPGILNYSASAGSLNAKEFLYQEQIRLRSSTEDLWQLAFHSERLEEPRRIERNSALELSFGPEDGLWRFGVLGDGHTEKAFADLGARLSYAPFEGAYWQIIGWSVDTFYTAKKLQREDYRTQDPWTWELTLQQNVGRSQIQLHHEQDKPVVWYQVSRDRRYAFRRHVTDLRWSWLGSAAGELFLDVHEDREHESLGALSQLDSKSYHDLTRTLELGHIIKSGRETYSYSIWGLWENIQYKSLHSEETLNQEMRRREIAGLWNLSQPFWNGQHTQHWGLVMNYVSLEEGKRKRATEVKFAWGPDFALGKAGRLRIKTTWDLDQLAGDFPFTEHPFHPWGGGQASFFMVF
jgi:hypothetical protein